MSNGWWDKDYVAALKSTCLEFDKFFKMEAGHKALSYIKNG